MSKKRKCVVLKKNGQKMEAKCPNCGHPKQLQYRKSGGVRRICGASDLQKPREVA